MTAARSGALLFARFAYPPNALGYCGPADSSALLEYASAGVTDPGLASLARRFDGAWPYLRLIASAAGIEDPLDARVVEAYWIGSPLLNRVPPGLLARTLEDHFHSRAGRRTDDLARLALAGGRAHHNFHVFGVYPWVGMLRAGHTAEPLHVLESCRIRWGEVLTVAGDCAIVRSRPLHWDGSVLDLGEERTEQVTACSGALALAPRARPGDWVALHWNWICDTLDPIRLSRLRAHTARQLNVVNYGLSRPTAAAVLD